MLKLYTSKKLAFSDVFSDNKYIKTFVSLTDADEVLIYNGFETEGLTEEQLKRAWFLFDTSGEILTGEPVSPPDASLISFPFFDKPKLDLILKGLRLMYGDVVNISANTFIYISSVTQFQAERIRSSLKFFENGSVSAVLETIDKFNEFTDAELAAFIQRYSLSMSLKSLYTVQSYYRSQNKNPNAETLKSLDLLWSKTNKKYNLPSAGFDVDSDFPHIKETYNYIKEFYGDNKPKSLNDLAEMPLRMMRKNSELVDCRAMRDKFAMSADVPFESGTIRYNMLPYTFNASSAVSSDALSRVVQRVFENGCRNLHAMRISVGETYSKTQTGERKNDKILISDGYCSFSNSIDMQNAINREIRFSTAKTERHEHHYFLGAMKERAEHEAEEGDLIAVVGASYSLGVYGKDSIHHYTGLLKRFFVESGAAKFLKRAEGVSNGGLLKAFCALAGSFEFDVGKLAGTGNILNVLCSERAGRAAVIFDKNYLAEIESCASAEGLSFIVAGNVTGDGKITVTAGAETVFSFPSDFILKPTFSAGIGVMICEKPETLMSTEDKLIAGEYQKSVREGIIASCRRRNLRPQPEFANNLTSDFAYELPLGGKYNMTPAGAAVSKIDGNMLAVSAFGSVPNLSELSPFVYSLYSTVLAVNKLVACGCEFISAKLALSAITNELGENPLQWGDAASLILGSVYAQLKLGIPSLNNEFGEGGCISAVCFASGTVSSDIFAGNLFAKGQKLFRLKLRRDDYFIPDFKYLKKLYGAVTMNIARKNIEAAVVVESDIIGALVAALSGNGLGMSFSKIDADMFYPCYGDFIIAAKDISEFNQFDIDCLGIADDTGIFRGKGIEIKASEILSGWGVKIDEALLPGVRKTVGENSLLYVAGGISFPEIKTALPSVVIPCVYSNGERRLASRFEDAGGNVKIIKAEGPSGLHGIADRFCESLKTANIVALPPLCNPEILAALLGNERVKDALNYFKEKNEGLIIGFGAGVKALCDSGMLPGFKIPCKSSFTGRTATVSITSNLSPWLARAEIGKTYHTVVSSSYASLAPDGISPEILVSEGRVAVCFNDLSLSPSSFASFGSLYLPEGVSSSDGRIFGRLGCGELISGYKNQYGNFDMKIFESGINFFK